MAVFRCKSEEQRGFDKRHITSGLTSYRYQFHFYSFLSINSRALSTFKTNVHTLSDTLSSYEGINIFHAFLTICVWLYVALVCSENKVRRALAVFWPFRDIGN